MRAVFFGTPAISVPALEALTGIARVTAVICQPDRPAGRGLEAKAPAVKTWALEHGLAVHQPEKIRTPEFAAFLRSQEADLALVIAYGRILPPAILEAPRRGCLNLHASILPKLRGAAPITWAIVHGEKETGISLMQMDVGCDTGAVFTRHRIPIGPEQNAEELAADLGRLAAEVVLADVPRVVAGELVAEPQDHAAATEARLLKKEDGEVPWAKPAPAVHDHVRGMTPWPSAFTRSKGKLCKILATRIGTAAGDAGPPGTVLRADAGGIEIACGAGTLTVLRAQLEGKKPLAAAELAAGRGIEAGTVLGR